MNEKLLIFNPDSDLALAYGIEGYTAPPHAQQLRRDLQMLPAWFHDSDGAAILSQNREEDDLWLKEYAGHWTGSAMESMTINQLQNREVRSFLPWGWNLDIRQRLINGGAKECYMPSREQIMRYRECSHRAISIKLLEWLRKNIDYPFPASPVEARTVVEIQEFERMHPRCFIKAPWSSSGRGVYRVLEPESRNFVTWAQGIINRQGSIMCEAVLDKVMDFALEYVVEGGIVSFFGYSVFRNDAHNSFDVGLVARSEKLRQMIACRLGNERLLDEVLMCIKDFLQRNIAQDAGYEDGCIGVDMLLYHDKDGRVMLAPCVEINLRRTMGHVAVSLGDTFAADDAVGHFHVEYLKRGGAAEYIKSMAEANPIKIAASRIDCGVMPLVPAYRDSKYCAYIKFGEQR